MIRLVLVNVAAMTAVFDDHDRQVPMLQGRWELVKDKLIPAIERCRPEIKDALGLVWPALPDNPFCRPDCGYYCDSGRNCPCMKCWLSWHNNTYPSQGPYTVKAR
jgi:hypothetical protein